MAASTAPAVAAPKSTDLTAKLLPHLDRHLVLPLLDFLESRGTYTHEEVLQAKFDLLNPTNMVTFVLGLKRELDGETDENAPVPQGELFLCGGRADASRVQDARDDRAGHA